MDWSGCTRQSHRWQGLRSASARGDPNPGVATIENYEAFLDEGSNPRGGPCGNSRLLPLGRGAARVRDTLACYAERA